MNVRELGSANGPPVWTFIVVATVGTTLILAVAWFTRPMFAYIEGRVGWLATPTFATRPSHVPLQRTATLPMSQPTKTGVPWNSFWSRTNKTGREKKVDLSAVRQRVPQEQGWKPIRLSEWILRPFPKKEESSKTTALVQDKETV